MQQQARQWQSEQKRVGFVPTMGALHEGHLSLVKESLAHNETTVVSIFVNPAQFGPGEDFESYPRTLENDLAMLDQLGVDLLFLPSQDDFYQDGFSTYIEPPVVANRFEGTLRKDHFRGVTTVVLKLFMLTLPTNVYFGQKDFQQCAVLSTMIDDLALPVQFHRMPIVREEDGLAMSSRNRYLSESDREKARAISAALFSAQAAFENGEKEGCILRKIATDYLQKHGIHEIDYLTIVDPRSLTEVETIVTDVVLLVAARIGTTRLLDNILLTE